ncbi:MAG: glycosyltransferase family 4 protein [Candidatus Sulfotelmatobacter sp.]
MALAQTTFGSTFQAEVRHAVPKLTIITEIIAPYRIPVFNALARREELDLHVIFLAETDPTWRQWRVYKEEIEFQYDVLPSWRRRIGKYHVLVNRRLGKALNRLRPDVLVCGGYNYLASWQALCWAKLHQVPVLLWTESTAQDHRDRHAPIEFLKSRFLRFCDGFVVPGSASAEYLKDLGIANDRIFQARNAIDIELFARLAQESRNREIQIRSELFLPSRYFLYVGRFVKEKGVFDLLRAYAQLDPRLRSEVGLVLAGNGADHYELMKQASGIKPGTIRFVGFVHREELPGLYAFADALILPTHSDTWGLVVNEGMSCGLPVIVTKVAGCARDLVKDGWNGCVVPLADSAQLSRAMAALAGDSELRRQMGMRSHQIIQEYSPAAWTDGMAMAFNAACHRNA